MQKIKHRDGLYLVPSEPVDALKHVGQVRRGRRLRGHVRLVEVKLVRAQKVIVRRPSGDQATISHFRRSKTP